MAVSQVPVGCIFPKNVADAKLVSYILDFCMGETRRCKLADAKLADAKTNRVE
jgi:hypothetical protein